MANRKSSSNTISVASPSSSSFAAATKKEKAASPAARILPAGESGERAKRVEWMREDIDASAEEFIKRFREDLRLQRLQSIENYKKMLARGV